MANLPQPPSPGSSALAAAVSPPAAGSGGPPTADGLDRPFETLAGAGVSGVALRYGTVVGPDPRPGGPDRDRDRDREEAVKAFRTALDRSGLHVVTVDADPGPSVPGAGALSHNAPSVRRLALRRLLDAVDLAADLGAGIVVVDARYEPAGRGLEQDGSAALDCYAEAVNASCAYVDDRGYDIEIAVSPCPDSLLPSPAHALAFLHELDRPDLVGLAPALDRQGGTVPFHQEAAQALWADKLFHVGLSGLAGALASADPVGGRRDAFLLVDLLLDAEWDGARRLGPVPLDGPGADGGPPAGPWKDLLDDVAAHRRVEEAAARLRADATVADAREAVGTGGLDEPTLPDGFTPESFADLRSPEAEDDDRAGPGGSPRPSAEAFEALDALLEQHLAALT